MFGNKGSIVHIKKYNPEGQSEFTYTETKAAQGSKASFLLAGLPMMCNKNQPLIANLSLTMFSYGLEIKLAAQTRIFWDLFIPSAF